MLWTVKTAVITIVRKVTGEPETLPHLKYLIQSYDDRRDIKNAVSKRIAKKWQTDRNTLLWLKHLAQDSNDPNIIYAVAQIIAKFWKNDRYNDDWNVKNVISKTIAQKRQNDPDTLLWLKHLAEVSYNQSTIHALAQTVVRGWENDLDILAILKHRACSNYYDYQLQCQIIWCIAQAWKDNLDTLIWLKDIAKNADVEPVREAAAQALFRGWKNDPDTLPILKHHVRFNCCQDPYFQCHIIEYIAQAWKDVDTLTWLKDIAKNAGNWDVRGAAVQTLLRDWKNAPDTLPILKYRVRFDRDRPSRSPECRVLKDIVQGWKDDPDTLPWLQELVEDSIEDLAITEIILGWKDHPDVLPWFKNLIAQHSKSYFQHLIFEALAKSWRNDPDTLLFLIHIARCHDDNNTRSSALSFVQKFYENDSSFLCIFKSFALDNDWIIRIASLRALAECRKYRLSIFDFLHSVLLDDIFKQNFKAYNPRLTVLKAIDDKYRDRSEVINLLLDRSQNDSDNWVREYAQKQLVIWRNRKVYWHRSDWA